MKVAGAAFLLVAGAVTALATTALHQLWWGLTLGAAATLVALVAVGPGWWTRLPFAVGWVGLLAWLVPTRAEGDFVISADVAGLTLLGLGLVVLLGALATLPRASAGFRDADGGDRRGPHPHLG